MINPTCYELDSVRSQIATSRDTEENPFSLHSFLMDASFHQQCHHPKKGCKQRTTAATIQKPLTTTLGVIRCMHPSGTRRHFCTRRKWGNRTLGIQSSCKNISNQPRMKKWSVWDHIPGFGIGKDYWIR